MSGYIKLHRQLLDSYQFSNPNLLKIWVWMLLKANYKPKMVSVKVSKGYTDVLIERGQFIFGRSKASEELNLDESLIYRIIKKFENEESIVVKSNNQYSIITICKYDEYNCEEFEVEQPMNNGRTTDEQPMNTTKKDKNGNKGKNKGNLLPLNDKELFFLKIFNETTNRSFKTLDDKARRQFSFLLESGYTSKDIKKAISFALPEMTERKRQNYLTPEFISRETEFIKYVNMVPIDKSEKKEEVYTEAPKQVNHQIFAKKP